jgi:hypothetical protein
MPKISIGQKKVDQDLEVGQNDSMTADSLSGLGINEGSTLEYVLFCAS